MGAGPEIGPTDPTGRSCGRDHSSFNWFRGDRNITFAVCQPWCGRRLTRGASNMTEALASKTWLPVAGEYLHSRASKLSSFTHRPRTGNWQRKLTASSGAFGFAISARRLPLFRRLVNSRKPKAIIRISASAGAMRRSLCRPRRSRDCMRTTSSWPPRLTAYSLGRPRREGVVVVLQLAPLFGAERVLRRAAD